MTTVGPPLLFIALPKMFSHRMTGGAPTFTSDPDLGQRFRSGVPGEADLTGLAVRRKAQLGKGLVRVTVGFADAVGSL